jgi:DNA-binding XRE family transcriptional regulator
MDSVDFRKWRKMLCYTQPEAGGKLGVDRSTIQNWERGFTPVPRTVELACAQLTRKWKQEPQFGPVSLVYGGEPIWPVHAGSASGVFVRCNLHPTNESAIQQGVRLSQTSDFKSPFIVDEAGEIIWSTPELLSQIQRAKRKRGK